jgi:hypothetical protein
MEELELELEPEQPSSGASWTPSVVDNVIIQPTSTDDLELELESEVDAPAAGQALISSALVEVLPADFPLPLLARFIPNQALRTAVVEASHTALSVEVAGADGLTKADEAMGVLRACIKDVEAHFEDPTKVANDLHKRLTGLRAEWTRDGAEALKTVGQRVFTEAERLRAIDADDRRRAQAEEDRKAKDRAAQEAEQAAQQGAPAEVVQEMQEQAKAATAPPVARPSSVGGGLRNSSVTKSWKARIVGTPAEAEPNPSTTELTPAQRPQVMALLKAILEGRAPIAAIDLNWSYLNKRAGADKSAIGIPGIEAFQVGGVRGKGGR